MNLSKKFYKAELLDNRIKNIESYSKNYNDGLLDEESYKIFLKYEIKKTKGQVINSLKTEIQKHTEELTILKEINYKVKNNLNLTAKEKEYILLNI